MPDSGGGVRVILVGGGRALRSAVRDRLSACDHRVVAETVDGVEAASLARHYRPDVLVLLGPDLGSRDALHVIDEVARMLATVRTILVTPDAATDLELRALMAGAGACLSLTNWQRMLLPAIGAVTRGEILSSREAAADLVRRLQAAPTAGQGIRPVRSSLSAREWQVLDLLAAAYSPEEVARQLGMSATTVQTHLKHVCQKLGVHGREAAIAAARELIDEALVS